MEIRTGINHKWKLPSIPRSSKILFPANYLYEFKFIAYKTSKLPGNVNDRHSTSEIYVIFTHAEYFFILSRIFPVKIP